MPGFHLFGRLLAGLLLCVVGTVGGAAWGGVLGGTLFGCVVSVAVAAWIAAALRSRLLRLESVLRLEGTEVPSTPGRDEFQRLQDSAQGLISSFQGQLDTVSEDRNKLVKILGGMSEGVIAVGADEVVLHMNAAAGRILKIVPEHCVGKPIWQVTRVPEISATLAESMAEDDEVFAEVRLVGPAGDQIVGLHAAPLRNGAPSRGAVVVLNVKTEIRRLEEVRRDFVANVSHELKTPITAIRGFSETVLDDADMPERTRDRFLLKIRDQALRLSSIVSDLLTLARLESAGGMMEARPFDLREGVSATARVLTQSADEAGVHVSVDLAQEPCWVSGDQDALNQVTSNLLDNAIKYTARGGQVWVRLRQDEDHVYLEVEDTGPGIEPNDQQRVFERFYRVDKARSRELGGTGLGLSIVKHICLAHKADVKLESQPGKGSRFEVKLPVHPT